MTKIIGFTGRKRSGKDTAAAVAVQEGFIQLSFAAPMKLMLRQLLIYQGARPDVIQAMIEGDLKEEPSPYLAGRSPRYFMQKIGTEFGRDMIHVDFWANVLINHAQIYDRVVVSDVRYPNEVAAIHAQGGKVVHIARSGLVSNDNHSSETEIDSLPVDVHLLNDSTLEDFNSKVQGMIRNTLYQAA